MPLPERVVALLSGAHAGVRRSDALREAVESLLNAASLRLAPVFEELSRCDVGETRGVLWRALAPDDPHDLSFVSVRFDQQADVRRGHVVAHLRADIGEHGLNEHALEHAAHVLLG